jgi:hypothetical protein
LKRRLLTVLIAFDVFIFAVLTLGNCKRNETISSAAWSLDRDGKVLGKVFRPLIDLLFSPIERDHCQMSWYTENAHLER